MPTTKIVCRLFDANNTMLGFTVHEAGIYGDGMIRASDSIMVPIDTSGSVASVSWHWADVNVETRVPIGPYLVAAGQVVAVATYRDPLIVCGPLPGPLPPVTMRQSVEIGIPVGQMGARG